MTPKIAIIDEGEEYRISPREFVENRIGHPSTVRSILDQSAYLAEGILEDSANRSTKVVERALEEDVFPARVHIPGWFVNNNDELSEEYGPMHDGGTLKIEGLVENYSSDAWRIVAITDPEIPGNEYEYEWTFVPKSQVTIVRWVDVTGLEDADKAGEELIDAKRNADAEWDEKSWDEKLETIDGENA